MNRYLHCFSIVIFVGILASCGGGNQAQPSQPRRGLDLEVSGKTVVKLRVRSADAVVMEEQLTSLFEDGPRRTLAIVNADGATTHTYMPPVGWSLVDFAVHPSGEISAALTNAREVRIARLDATEDVRSDQLLADPLVPSDPYFDYTNSVKDDTAMQPVLTHDAARVAPLGESLALILRTGRNAVVAYRFDPDAGGAYHNTWRTLVEPGSSILGQGITSGSFDTFGQLVNQVQVFADSDATSTLAVGLVELPQSNFIFRAHTDFFGEPINANAGVLMTRINGADGHRLGTTVVDTAQRSELHGLRATTNGFALVGRVLTEVKPDGTGWNAFVAAIAQDGNASTYRVVDVDRGDILFDIAALPSGRFIAVGTSGYIQNPTGESVSESAQPLLVVLNADGSVTQRLNFSAGARHNQLTSLASFNGNWLLGGMANGPGTHSGDNDRTLITADGFARETQISVQ